MGQIIWNWIFSPCQNQKHLEINIPIIIVTCLKYVKTLTTHLKICEFELIWLNIFVLFLLLFKNCAYFTDPT